MTTEARVTIHFRTKHFALFQKSMRYHPLRIVNESGEVCVCEVNLSKKDARNILKTISQTGMTFLAVLSSGWRAYGNAGKYEEHRATEDGSLFLVLNDDGEIDSENEWDVAKEYLFEEAKVRKSLYA